ncbi:MAG TPA: hypothetical protein VJ183_17940 [Chloroflexia bacterium]|nr:hypothetical protein [Chloroflexia bacterium]
MKRLNHLRQKAVELRTQHNMSLDDISTRLNLSRTTVYYWIRGITIERTEKQKAGQKAGTASMQAKCAARREAAYNAALEAASTLLQDHEVRDFVVLYLAEGYRKDRNKVSFSNSNPIMVRFANKCMRRLASNPHFYYSFQYHSDQNPDDLKLFWGMCLGIAPELIHPIPKTNSGHLAGRRFACKYGVFQIQISDTRFRAELQALMDVVQEQWTTSSI